LVAVCDDEYVTGTVTLISSSDGGTTFSGGVRIPYPLSPLSSDVLATPRVGTVVRYFNDSVQAGLLATTDGGRSWTPRWRTAPSSVQIADLGFTTTTQGVAVVVQSQLLMT